MCEGDVWAPLGGVVMVVMWGGIKSYKSYKSNTYNIIICEYGSIVWCGDSGGVGFTVCVCVKEGQ